ncbi:DUF397 domain-containing protein [Streptomyces sp. NPDC048506]|uniref:DUF397 domain-containing protein n=1 Tax=Streptomyces sp. NPDC048506 TaxID=3155028 RepID=UPI00343216D8
MREFDLSTAQWRKSSYSDDNNGNCIEVADGVIGLVPVRDSKNPHGPAVTFRAPAWSAFINAVKNARFETA